VILGPGSDSCGWAESIGCCNQRRVQRLCWSLPLQGFARSSV
jgi:hypothetical protein